VTPVYPAGEEPIEGVDSAALADGLRAHGHRMVRTVESQDELWFSQRAQKPRRARKKSARR